MIQSSREALLSKLKRLHWLLLFVVVALCCTGFVLLYDAAGGSISPWAGRQAVRFVVGLAIVFFIALVDVKWWYESSYLIYFLCLALLAWVLGAGYIGMGAQRWINLGVFNLQPSELAKIGTLMALAAYFQNRNNMQLHSIGGLFMLALIVAVPMVMTVVQPDLGTALIIGMVASAVMFLGGLSWKLFAIGGIGSGIAAPVMWFFFLRDYQKQRVLTFLNPENDPYGSGYHIIQSKIAIGSTDFWGKGLLQGSQSHLQFLPEKHTDFIFTLFVEEFGMAGALGMMGSFGLVIFLGLMIALRAQSLFTTLVAGGVIAMIFFHTIINMGMVMGLMPVVGVPLPFISYGGTSMLTMLIGIGLVLNAHIHRDVVIHSGSSLSERRF